MEYHVPALNAPGAIRILRSRAKCGSILCHRQGPQFCCDLFEVESSSETLPEHIARFPFDVEKKASLAKRPGSSTRRSEPPSGTCSSARLSLKQAGPNKGGLVRSMLVASHRCRREVTASETRSWGLLYQSGCCSAPFRSRDPVRLVHNLGIHSKRDRQAVGILRLLRLLRLPRLRLRCIGHEYQPGSDVRRGPKGVKSLTCLSMYDLEGFRRPSLAVLLQLLSVMSNE